VIVPPLFKFYISPRAGVVIKGSEGAGKVPFEVQGKVIAMEQI